MMGASSGIGAISAKGVRPQGWTTAFAEQSEKSFADMLAEDVMLEASTLARPIVGRNHVKHFMGVTSKIYEALAFTHQAESGARTYLEWQAKAFGGESFAGVTVLTKDERGLIAHVTIHHRPLAALLRFFGGVARAASGYHRARPFLQRQVRSRRWSRAGALT
ncbi:MAG TPA: hypothetical protein VGH39_06155 [Xanthobacteraceae bacterium]